MNMMYGGYQKPGTRPEDVELFGIPMHPLDAATLISFLVAGGIGLLVLCVYLIRKFYMRNSAS